MAFICCSLQGRVTLLHAACEYGSVNIVKLLLCRGAQIDQPTNVRFSSLYTVAS